MSQGSLRGRWCGRRYTPKQKCPWQCCFVGLCEKQTAGLSPNSSPRAANGSSGGPRGSPRGSPGKGQGKPGDGPGRARGSSEGLRERRTGRLEKQAARYVLKKYPRASKVSPGRGHGRPGGAKWALQVSRRGSVEGAGFLGGVPGFALRAIRPGVTDTQSGAYFQ